MKFLLVSDLHYALKQYDWTADVAPAFDVVVIAGDHLDIAGQLDGRVQIVVILKYLRRMAAQGRVIISSGNHDLDLRNGEGEKVALWMQRVRQLGVPTDGDTVEYGDTLVTICPWWDGPNARELVAAQVARDAEKPKKTWIWIHHAPPFGSPTAWDGRKAWGDSELTGWIAAYQPDYVLTGHIHQAPFRHGGAWIDRIGRTWVFNAGRQTGVMPAHIMLDTGAQEAVWVSLAGAERADLTRDLESQRPLPGPESAPWLALSTPDHDPIQA